jgi:hypothetical protein
LISALAASGCSDDDDFGAPPPPPPGPGSAVGTLVFDWSIQGRQDADVCVEVGAISFDAIIVDEGFVVGDVSAPCEDFEASVDLYVDDFLARSTLLDDRRLPALGRIIDDFFLIDEGLETRLILDFPGTAVPMEPAPDAGLPDAGPGDVGSPDASPDEPLPNAGSLPDEATPDAGAPDATAEQP